MKIKISKRVISLLLAILVCITATSLTASAYMVNANGLPGTPGSVYVDGYGSWHLPDYGARVTLVDATTGEAIPEYVSIDYTNRNYVPLPNGTKIPIENAKHFGKWCKSDYRAGMPLSLAAENDKYQRIEPPAGFPRMLNSGDPGGNVSIEKVKEYFGDEEIIRFFASNIGASFEEVASSKYKLLVEPLVCISLPSINEAYVATITELAMYNSATKKANGGDYDVGFVRDKWGSDWLPKNWSKSLFLKEPDIGYEAWKPTAAAVDDDTIFQKLGLATISFDAGNPTVYHHICNIKLNIPKGAEPI